MELKGAGKRFWEKLFPLKLGTKFALLSTLLIQLDIYFMKDILLRGNGSPEKGFWGRCGRCCSCQRGNLLLLGLLGEKDGLDVGEDTTLSDGNSGEKLVQLLVVADGELEMSGDDSRLLVVTGSVTGQLEDLSSEVLEDGGQVDGGASTNSLGVVSLTKESVNTTDGELKSRTAGSALCLSLRLSSLSASRHDVWLKCVE